MAIIQNNPTPRPSNSAPAKPNRTPLLLGIIGLLLAALIALGIAYMNRGTDNAQLSTDLMEMEEFKLTAEKQYYASIAELEEMRGSNEDLSALIDQQKEELRTQKDKIEALARDSRNLGAARRELDQLKNQMQGYLLEIEELRNANAELTENNERLTSERDLLSNDLQASRQRADNLNSERAVLVNERDRLTSDNQELNRKVNIASVLKTDNVTMAGQRQRKNGRWVDRRNSKYVERLYICFNSLDNEVADMGEETFQVRIINPTGETIQIDAEGSGILTSAETGNPIPYTTEVGFAFDGAASEHCAQWAVAKQSYREGTYTAELYNKGYLVGTGSVTLK